MIISGVPPAAPSHAKNLTDVDAIIIGILLSLKKSFVVAIIINLNVKVIDCAPVNAQFFSIEATYREN